MRGSFALQLGESIVWQGKPSYRKWYLPFIILDTAFLMALLYLVPPVPVSSGAWQGFTLIFGLLILLGLYSVSKYAAVRYYITDRRVVRSQELPIFRNTKEIPLQSLVKILDKRWRRRGIGGLSIPRRFNAHFQRST